MNKLNTFTDDESIFPLTRQTTASRLFALKGDNRRNSVIGAFAFMESDGYRAISFESNLERMAALLLSTTVGLEDLRDQPYPVTYRSANGKPRKHTLDYQVKFDGKTVGYACKLRKSAVRKQLRTDLGLILDQHPQFDDIKLVTEEDFSRDDALEAEIKFFVMMEIDDEVDDVVREVLRDLREPTTIHEIVERSGFKGRGYRSLLRLMGKGYAVRAEGGRVDDYSTKIARVIEWPSA